MGKTRTSTAGNRTSQGYTLIELCVVLALIGIMLFIAAPQIHDMLYKDSVHTAMKYIVNKSRELRLDAVRENVDYVMHFDLDRNLLWYETSDMTAAKRDEMKKMSLKLPDNVKILQVAIVGGGKKSQGDATVKFFRRGYTQPAMLYLSQHDRVFTLVFNPFSGTARIYDRLVEIDENKAEFSLSRKECPFDMPWHQTA